jgi:hypothetical protein
MKRLTKEQRQACAQLINGLRDAAAMLALPPLISTAIDLVLYLTHKLVAEERWWS